MGRVSPKSEMPFENGGNILMEKERVMNGLYDRLR